MVLVSGRPDKAEAHQNQTCKQTFATLSSILFPCLFVCFHSVFVVFPHFPSVLSSDSASPTPPPLPPSPPLLTLLVFSCFPTIFAIQSSTRFFNPYVFHMCISYEFHIWLKMFDMSMILQDSKVSSFPRCSGPDLDQGAARGPKGGVRSPEPLHPYSSNYPQIRAFSGFRIWVVL